jgi:CheY-like chemotaxis protein
MTGSAGAAESASEEARGKGRGSPHLRILIVEDEVIIAWELSELLRQLGHEPLGIALDAAEAVEMAARLAPDLVLMDVRLRRGDDGVTAAEAIQARRPVRVVFATAYAQDPQTRARMLAANAAGILSKPILLSDLRRALAVAAGG